MNHDITISIHPSISRMRVEMVVGPTYRRNYFMRPTFYFFCVQPELQKCNRGTPQRGTLNTRMVEKKIKKKSIRAKFYFISEKVRDKPVIH